MSSHESDKNQIGLKLPFEHSFLKVTVKPMQQPMFPRLFSLPSSLYSLESPWNQKVDQVISDIENQRVMLVAFEILREFSWEALAKKQKCPLEVQSRLIRRLASEVTNTDHQRERIQTVEERSNKENALLEVTDDGMDRGGIQSPYIGCQEFTFPIFPIRDSSGNRTLSTVEIKSYKGESWEPFYEPQRQVDEAWFADDVPMPEGRFRPSGPKGTGSDGAMILYDQLTGEEIDFWQVTTSDGSTQGGGGQVGDQILAAGSLARFQSGGLGARLPSEPQGSSRATGLPYLGGLLVPEDFQAGLNSVIKHALAFTFPRSRYFPFRLPGDPRDFIYPAVNSETAHFTQNPYALAAGMRIRLKSTIRSWSGLELSMDEWKSRLPPVVSMFLTALHDYGAFLVDGAAGFGIAAEDKHTANISADLVQQLIGKTGYIGKTETPWEALIETINEYLSWHLFKWTEDAPEEGLSLGFLKKKDGRHYDFTTNFEVVLPLPAPE